MTLSALDKRLCALEAYHAFAPPTISADEIEAAAQAFSDSLENPTPSDPRHDAYIASHTLEEIAADYAAMLRGAPAPWLEQRSQP